MKKISKEILIGILLVLRLDHIRRSGANKAYITFEQSLKKTEYFNYVHELLRKEGLNVSDSKTYVCIDPRHNKTNESIHFTTKAMEELKPLADMFLDEEGKKKIPSNIGEYLTHKGLAHLIMDDGQQVKNGGVTLCTDSYKSEEISILRKALKTNFNLITTIHTKRKDGAEYERIYINKSSLEEVKPLLK